MATISTDNNGNRKLQFTDANRRRRTVYLGKMSIKKCEGVQRHVERILASQMSREALEPETARWVGELDDVLHEKLCRAGLVEKRASAVLGEFLKDYLAGRTDCKPRSLDKMQRAANHLKKHFGDNKLLRDITPGDVEEFSRLLFSELGDNSARRRLSYCKQFFRFALRKRQIDSNPFGELKGLGVRENKSRDHFVTRADAAKILEACPSLQWKLIFSFARFGGLRVPSELLALRWTDIHWDTDRITVPSPKTAHFEGQESRIVPLFPELKGFLNEAWIASPDGAEFVIDRCRDENRNLRTTMTKIIKRAGLKPWPKLFQNLRASRATELAAEYPGHVAAAWMGHSTMVAQKHYWRVRDVDFEKATQIPTQPLTNQAELCGVCESGDDEFSGNVRLSSSTSLVQVGPEGLEPPTKGL